MQSQPGVLPRQPKPSTPRRWVPWLIMGGMLLSGMTAFFCITGLLLAAYLTPEKLPQGVRIAGLLVGGDSVEDATARLQQHFANLTITLTDGTRSWQLPLAELGVWLDIPATLQQAEDTAPGTNLTPRYGIDLNQAQNGLVMLSAQVNIAAVPGNPPQIGRAVEIPVMLDRLRIDVTGELADGILELNMIEIEPPEIETANVYTGATTTHTVERGQELALIAREYGVSLDDIVRLNDLSNPNLIYVGQELTIPAASIYTPTAEDAPAAPTSTGKSIVVSTREQRIYAYENGHLVRSHLTSTGRSQTPTVLGDYKIYVKYTATDMSGPDYFLPQVPYTMYFYQGYGIHGTYWHNSFGRPMSHGCVNLPIDEARWFFDWAEVGTPVRVI